MVGEIVAKVEEIAEVSEQVEAESFKDIKPMDEGMSVEEADDFWNEVFHETDDTSIEEIESDDETIENDNAEENLEEVLDEYFDDLKGKSECPETVQDNPFNISDLEKQPPEKTAEMRDEFDDKKTELKRQWEENNGMSWPKYEKDVYSCNDKLIRKAGSDYDAHHIQPLAMGGKNEVSNITPLTAEVHYDKQGVHSPNSPYSRMDKMLGEMD